MDSIIIMGAHDGDDESEIRNYFVSSPTTTRALMLLHCCGPSDENALCVPLDVVLSVLDVLSNPEWHFTPPPPKSDVTQQNECSLNLPAYGGLKMNRMETSMHDIDDGGLKLHRVATHSAHSNNEVALLEPLIPLRVLLQDTDDDIAHMWVHVPDPGGFTNFFFAMVVSHDKPQTPFAKDITALRFGKLTGWQDVRVTRMGLGSRSPGLAVEAARSQWVWQLEELLEGSQEELYLCLGVHAYAANSQFIVASNDDKRDVLNQKE
eukprot:PhM_4_TR4278/c0_g1_i1/m.98628